MAKKILGFVSMVVAAVMFSLVAARADTNTHFRYANTFVKQINQDWTVYLYQEFNFDGDHHHDLLGVCNEPGVVYSGLAKWLDITLAACTYHGKTNSEWQGQVVPYVAGTLKWTLAGFDISNKSRIEYDQRNYKLYDRWRYRDVFSIVAPYKWTLFQIQPFVANELYYDFQAHYLTGNQLKMGIQFPVVKHVSALIWYMRDMSHSNLPDDSHWKTTPTVGFETVISF
ncbi:MAG: DUF2490 domain-containing protein [Candidatus Omnitrophica bacterium]|nr:DUF2490 domain-containing protein [Candidatus Omnitrophota bacterium]